MPTDPILKAKLESLCEVRRRCWLPELMLIRCASRMIVGHREHGYQPYAGDALADGSEELRDFVNYMSQELQAGRWTWRHWLAVRKVRGAYALVRAIRQRRSTAPEESDE